MDKKRNMGKLLREQRKSIPLSLNQLSEMSGVSASHLTRVENGERVALPKSLQRITKPLGFDLKE
jgi:transcriptional regulator with XRE-family HTH domain